ncbi:Mad3/BUB1 homology region 1-domain-containing protein [Mycena olivaceomarginata]|nr:Mad3/BUB1 homology region 1-domain-containing protein [Mycena olivaceomarginata]
MATEDVFSDAPNIVDCDVLEAAKENVQPLATGRRATALSAILSTPHAQRESKLAATRNRLRINVELALEDEEDDPLEAYCRLVNWTNPALLELLEEATRVLKDNRDGKWRGEIKYLKLWLLYASFVEKPTIIYSFLIANEIGTAFAILYEELAAVMERDGRRKEADDAYLLGIARRASPLEHLKARHADFQKRMMCAAALPAAPCPGRFRYSWIRRRNPPTAAGNAFPDVGTRKTRVKENVPEAKKMAGSTLRQPGKTRRTAPGAAATSSFVPYKARDANRVRASHPLPNLCRSRTRYYIARLSGQLLILY